MISSHLVQRQALILKPAPRHRRRIEDGEVRYDTIGQIYGVLLLLAAHTVAEEEPSEIEWIRIISRRATKAERKRYESEEDRTGNS